MSMPALQIMPGGRIPIEIAGIHEVQLTELLGVGGFSSVWKVTDTDTGRFYTLKIIPSINPGSVQAERVRLEAEVSVPSQYIVSVIGLREWDPSTFLILFEHFNGTSLDTLLQKVTLSSAQKKHIFIQILKGVAVAHHHNVIHRDLKPGNILVDVDKNTKLIDFGISKFKGVRITKSGEIIGTVEYMAPELIIQGAEVADARCDIYSLGHLFYEIVTGQHFWKRKGWGELEDVVKYMDQVPSPAEAIELDDFRCDFFLNAREILAKMVKIDPQERYETVDAILQDLGEDVLEIPSLPLEDDIAISDILPVSSDFDLRSPLLIVESGANRLARTVLGLHEGEIREIGRFDLAGSDTSISRKHLEISRHDDRYYIRDIHSKNGTMLRGILLKPGADPVEIYHADHIKVGDIFLRFAFVSKEK
jgi:serine/threonine protein kinase